jgi:hypothetical protein
MPSTDMKARTKSKDIGGSDRLPAVCVCERVKMNGIRVKCITHKCNQTRAHYLLHLVNKQIKINNGKNNFTDEWTYANFHDTYIH